MSEQYSGPAQLTYLLKVLLDHGCVLDKPGEANDTRTIPMRA